MKIYMVSPRKKTSIQDSSVYKRLGLIDEIEKDGTVLTQPQRLDVLLYGRVRSDEELEKEAKSKALTDKFIVYGFIPATILSFVAVIVTLM